MARKVVRTLDGKTVDLLDQEANEHDITTNAKKVISVDGSGSSLPTYEYMGKKTSGNYVYYGFKEKSGTNWKIKRKDTTDESAWKFVYGTSGWSSAWADPTALSYNDPPD